MTSRLVYDGDCGFCRYTVEYARSLTGTTVEYRPYQEVGSEYPELDQSEFAGSIQLFTGGERQSGARGVFEVLALGGRRSWLNVYRHVPGMAAMFEWLYRFVAAHREPSYRIARGLFGRRLTPRRHEQTADWLYRGIALCGLFAFTSFWWQAHGLIGSDGILPIAPFLEAVADRYDSRRLWILPTLFWIDASDVTLHLVCCIGALASVVGLLGRLRASAAVVAYLCYLSLLHAGQTFMSYQWDTLLVECFVLAAILARAPTLGIWVARLLLFRFILLSGAVKLLSADPTWADASALSYHFETQPLPTALAWYAHHLVDVVLEWGVHLTFFIELILPFCIFLPRNPRLLAGAGFVLLELLILLTGSYNFFNLLTIVLCMSLLDDGAFARLRGIPAAKKKRWVTLVVAGWIMVQGLVLVATSIMRTPLPSPIRATSSLLVANAYGLFAVMTTERYELVIEGSADGEQWQSYGFPFKPGPVDAAPGFATPHQPRVDWQMWFAALGSVEQAPWIYEFTHALLEARPAVLALIEDPFNGSAPRFVRIVRYRYRFTSPEERAISGAWWERGPATEWLPPVRLRTPKITHEILKL